MNIEEMYGQENFQRRIQGRMVMLVQLQSQNLSLMLMVYTIWLGMFGNGHLTGLLSDIML